MWHFLFSFRGRVSLGQMWLFYIGAAICWGIVVAVIYGIAAYAGIPDPLSDAFLGEPISAGGWCIFGLLTSAYALLVVCFMAAMSKRLHDRNRSAWWLVPIYGCVAVLVTLDTVLSHSSLGFDSQWMLWNGVTIVSMVVLGIAAVWLMLELFILPGTRGDNRFGPDPRRIDRPVSPA